MTTQEVNRMLNVRLKNARQISDVQQTINNQQKTKNKMRELKYKNYTTRTRPTGLEFIATPRVPETDNRQQLTDNNKQSTINNQPSATNYKLSARGFHFAMSVAGSWSLSAPKYFVYCLLLIVDCLKHPRRNLLTLVNILYRLVYPPWSSRQKIGAAAMAVVLMSTILMNLFLNSPAEAIYSGGASGKGLLAYAAPAGSTTQLRQWNFGNSSFGPQTNTGVGNRSGTTVIKTSPTVPDLWLQATWEGGNVQLLRSTDGGTTWTADTFFAVSSSSVRAFDLAFEQNSGEAVFMYSNNSTTDAIAIRRFTSSWQSPTTFNPSTTANVVTWMELDEKPNSDELALSYVTNPGSTTANISAAIWDGSSNALGNEPAAAFGACDSGNDVSDGLDKCFDINYETGSGKPVVSWGGNATVNAARYVGSGGSGCPSGGTLWSCAAISGLADSGTMLDCDSDPSSGSVEIACISYSDDSLDTQVWTVVGGTTGIVSANVDIAGHSYSIGQMFVASTYVISGGNRIAIVTYSEASDNDVMDYLTFNGSTWTDGLTATEVSTTNNTEEIVIAATNPYDQSEALIVYSNFADGLYALKFRLSGSTLTASLADGGASMGTVATIYKLPFDMAFEPRVPQTKITQDGYIWENDDGAADTSSQQAAGNTAITGVKKGERLTLRTQLKNTGAGYSKADLGLFYDRNDGNWNKVKGATKPVASDGNCNDVGSGLAGWQCDTVDDRANTVGYDASLAFAPNGTAWVSHYNNTSGYLTVSHYVGSGGNCDSVGTGSDAWQCDTVDHRSGVAVVGHYTSLAFDPSGTPWVSHQNATTGALVVSHYVGSGGNCDSVGTGGSDAWQCDTVDDRTNAVGSDTSLAFDPSGTPWVSHQNSSTGALVVSHYVGSGGNCDSVGTGSDAWQCDTVDDRTDNVGGLTSLAFAPDGTPWVSHRNASASALVISHFVGSGGNCAVLGTGLDSWQCDTVDDRTTEGVGYYISLAFDPAGSPWVSHYNETTNALVVSHYVGANGNCDSVGTGSDAWQCDTVDDRTDQVGGSNTSLAFDPSGTPWVSHQNSSTGALVVSKYVGSSGEIIMAPGQAGANGDATSESHADMGAPPDDSDRDDADCLTAATWNNGKWFEGADGSGLKLNGGSVSSQCTEVSFVIDTSQAISGTTYRFVIASEDAIRRDKGPWRGSISVASGAYPTLTIEADTPYRWSKDNTAKFTNCTDTNWGCITVDDSGGTSGDTGRGANMAIAPDGTPWIVHQQVVSATSTTVIVAKYVGSGGDCSSTAWDCETIETMSADDFTTAGIAFDQEGNPWITYHDPAAESIKIAKYTASGKEYSCGTTTNWACTTIMDSGATGNGQEPSLAFDPAGNPWVTFYHDDATIGDSMFVAQLVGTGGTGCTGGSTAWKCTEIDDDSLTFGFSGSSIAFDQNGRPWVSYFAFGDSAAPGTCDAVGECSLQVARYVGSGGTGCTGNTEWTCDEVDDGTAAADRMGEYSSIAFDSSNTAWVSYYDLTNTALKVAKFVTSGGDCDNNGGSDAWTCTTVVNAGTEGRWTSIAMDINGNPWIASEGDSTSLKVSRYVGGGTGTGCTSGSTDWTCVKVDDPATPPDLGRDNSLAFDHSGAPWIAYRDNGDGTCNASGECLLKVAKLHVPMHELSSDAVTVNNGRNAIHGDARYRLNFGASPRTANCGNNSVADMRGSCAVFAGGDADYDKMLTGANERPMYTMAHKTTSNTDRVQATWVGRTDLAPSTGNVKLEVYRFGSTNAWETMTTMSTGSCSSSDCNIYGVPSGTVGDYYETVGSDKYIYFRIWQESTTSAITFKTSSFVVEAPADNQMRGGSFFYHGAEKSFELSRALDAIDQFLGKQGTILALSLDRQTKTTLPPKRTPTPDSNRTDFT